MQKGKRGTYRQFKVQNTGQHASDQAEACWGKYPSNVSLEGRVIFEGQAVKTKNIQVLEINFLRKKKMQFRNIAVSG